MSLRYLRVLVPVGDGWCPCRDGQAVAIAFGVSLFSLSQSSGPKDGKETNTEAIGLFLIVMYLVCDSFTSQWQDRIFKKHKIDQYQMMFGVNCFSIFFTCFSLTLVRLCLPSYDS